MPEPKSIFSSFAFYERDVEALNQRLEELMAAGVELKRARFLKALVHVTSEAEMLHAAKRLADDEQRGGGAISARPQVELLVVDLEKLDRVAELLSKRDIISGANRAFVLRALARFAPNGAQLAPAVSAFLEAFPRKPRGLSKLRLEQQKRRG